MGVAFDRFVGLFFGLTLISSCSGNDIQNLIEDFTSNFHSNETTDFNSTSIQKLIEEVISNFNSSDTTDFKFILPDNTNNEQESRVPDEIRQEVERQLPSLLEEGFKIAEKLLLRERDSVKRRLKTGLKPPPSVLYRSRSKNLSSKRRNACRSLGLLETSKIIVERFNIPKEEASGFLRSIAVPEEVHLRNRELCDIEDLKRSAAEGGPITCDYNYPYRSIDGTCNNPDPGKERNGATGSILKRFIVNAYDDGIGAMRGDQRPPEYALPNPREVSARLSESMDPGSKKEEYLTQMFKAFGQFLDHDLALTAENTGGDVDGDGIADHIPCCDSGTDPTPAGECRPIDVSSDQSFTSRGITCLRFVRSLPAGPVSSLSPREQLNEVTSYVDASNVYGSTVEHANNLRAFSNGKMKVTSPGENGETSGLLHYLPADPQDPKNFFKAGDKRVNEQPGLTSMHTVFLRLHNRFASEFSSAYPQATDETIYQECRRIVCAIIQHLTYNEFLPLLLGPPMMKGMDLMPKDAGYVDPSSMKFNIKLSVAHEFATAAYRFGHTLIGPRIKGINADKPLEKVFFNNKFMIEDVHMTPSSVIFGECEQKAERVDPVLTSAVTNFLFATKEKDFQDGSDLMSLNIMRGRDHGIPPYNKIRKFCGLAPFASFSEMRMHLDGRAVDVFEELYSHVDEVDFFPAGLAEKKVSYGRVGPTFACIIGIQFYELKFADRFFYEGRIQPKPFTPEQLSSIRSVSAAAVFCSTTSIDVFQPLAFIRAPIPGNVLTSCEDHTRNTVIERLLQLWTL